MQTTLAALYSTASVTKQQLQTPSATPYTTFVQVFQVHVLLCLYQEPTEKHPIEL